MDRAAEEILQEYFRQTVVLVLLGSVWLGNAVVIGSYLVKDPLEGIGCAVGIANFGAYRWTYYAMYGYSITLVLLFAFGFLADYITRGRKRLYSLLIFVSPWLGLVTSNLGKNVSVSIENIFGVILAYGIGTLLIALFYLPGQMLHRRLTNRRSGYPNGWFWPKAASRC